MVSTISVVEEYCYDIIVFILVDMVGFEPTSLELYIQGSIQFELHNPGLVLIYLSSTTNKRKI